MIKINISKRALLLIDQLKDFDIEDFTAWYFRQSIGTTMLYGYMTEKAKKKEKDNGS